MNLYEHTIVARQDVSPAQIKQLTEKYTKIVEKNDGKVIQTQNWGLISLSYNCGFVLVLVGDFSTALGFTFGARRSQTL